MEQIADIGEESRIQVIEKRVRIGNKRGRRTERMLAEHMTECARLQKWVLRLGTVTLAWIVLHSPEAAKAAVEIAKLMFP